MKKTKITDLGTKELCLLAALQLGLNRCDFSSCNYGQRSLLSGADSLDAGLLRESHDVSSKHFTVSNRKSKQQAKPPVSKTPTTSLSSGPGWGTEVRGGKGSSQPHLLSLLR